MQITSNTDSLREVQDFDSMMMRFISKEGINEYPTVILLSNRYFLSDEKYLGGDTVISSKMKLGDSYKWYRSADLCTNIRKSIVEDITSSCTFFEKQTEDSEYIGITRYLRTGNGYYAFVGGKVYFEKTKLSGKVSSLTPISLISYFDGEQCGNIVDILTVDTNHDIIITPRHIFSYHTDTGVVTYRYFTDGVSEMNQYQYLDARKTEVYSQYGGASGTMLYPAAKAVIASWAASVSEDKRTSILNYVISANGVDISHEIDKDDISEKTPVVVSTIFDEAATLKALYLATLEVKCRKCSGAATVGTYLIVSTDNKALVVGNQTSNDILTYSEIEMKTWTETEPPKDGSSSASTVTVTNGITSNVFLCVYPVSANEMELIGPSASFKINVSSYLSDSKYVCTVGNRAGYSSYQYGGAYYLLGPTSGVYDGTGTYGTTAKPVSIFTTSSFIGMMDNANNLFLYPLNIYDSTKKLTFSSANGLPSSSDGVTIHSVYVNDASEVFLLGTTAVYKEIAVVADSDKNNVVAYFIPFVYDTDYKKTKVPVKYQALSPSKLMRLYCEDAYYNSIAANVDGLATTFVYIKRTLPSGVIWWYVFGKDNRRDTAFKDMASAFDIG